MVQDFKGFKAILIGGILGLAVLVAIVAGVRTGRLGQGDSGLSKDYQVDLQDMARTDPNLILFTQHGEPLPTGLKQSRALAVDAQGALHVLGNQVIKVFREGAVLRTVDLPVAARCFVVRDDRYVLGCGDHVVEVTLDGQALKTWETLGDKALITSVAVNDDYVFMADAGQRIVWCYDHGGGLIRRIGDRDVQRRIIGFNVPSPYFDLALAPGGRLCVTNPGNHRIETYTQEGELETWWGQFGCEIDTFTGCCNPVSFALLPDGRFVTCEKGLVRVKLYKADGSFAGVVAGADQLAAGSPVIRELPDQSLIGGFDVATDKDGRVYVLDAAKNLVRFYVEKEG